MNIKLWRTKSLAEAQTETEIEIEIDRPKDEELLKRWACLRLRHYRPKCWVSKPIARTSRLEEPKLGLPHTWLAYFCSL